MSTNEEMGFLDGLVERYEAALYRILAEAEDGTDIDTIIEIANDALGID